MTKKMQNSKRIRFRIDDRWHDLSI